ncbi:glycoside hydrolase family 31 protein [Flavivirga eckloniae]|uniref:Alpha-glucosidase n=1 Tax=Flavivirga eckloniae TaxID=1803846 RepID=A0A2K9PPM1_9FLAO|nr:TIM-barrel domain-containing protein [Flavivirga eckloniae]AUP78507.1 alpha-glucosidase [Flavivirga eckloniae]
MKKTVLFLLLQIMGVLTVYAQWSNEAIKPQRILKVEKEADKLHMTCDEGYMDLTFHSDKIIHFSFYPEYTNLATQNWGIKSSKGLVDTELDLWWEHYKFSSPSVEIKFNALTSKFKYFDKKGNLFLETDEVMMKPTTVQGEKTYHTAASFIAPPDEHYYGLGQHQSGWMDHKGKTVPMWHDYKAKDGEIISVPFMLTNKNYAIIYPNPSRSEVICGVDGKTTWSSEIGEAVSYYVIYGETIEDIYKSYGDLCGYTPLPPKKALGYIQCKQKYNTQEEVLTIAKTHKEKGYPIDYMVVDWFHWDQLGDLDMNKERWPNPKAMNEELKSMDINCMISCWPRFVSESKNFDILNKNGWLMKQKNGASMNSTAWDLRGGLIDVTNPKASEWYWNTIRNNYVSKGFDSFWLDESEPDIVPHNFYLSQGLGARIYNIYPYLHAKGMYEGHRRDLDDRVFVLTRSSWLGANQFGTTFWSSDIHPEWDVLERQIACGANFCASGMPYWSSDIGGWQGFEKERKAPTASLLLKSDKGPEDMYVDYPEMYVRWFQYGTFCPTFRAHGTRSENEVWSYGKEAEDILSDYIELRYNLMPYIYSNAWNVTKTNMPFMRGLFINYMDDEKAADIKDEYLFGSSILVAPISKPGTEKRSVYLPKNDSWYDLWTNKEYEGGKTITAKAPISKIPLYIKAGTILPIANNLKHANQKTDTLSIFIYEGADGKFELYEDENTNYNYENGAFSTIGFEWNNSENTLTIGDRQGQFPQMNETYTFKIFKIVNGKKVSFKDENGYNKQVTYTGESLSLKL